ncbi:MAG: hypothetical protein SGJ27_28420 [Candidatus Melainabacteria bacterium]|nr:hypothetical protein [Candidatus Melainabacteria bacterium]
MTSAIFYCTVLTILGFSNLYIALEVVANLLQRSWAAAVFAITISAVFGYFWFSHPHILCGLVGSVILAAPPLRFLASFHPKARLSNLHRFYLVIASIASILVAMIFAPSLFDTCRCHDSVI